MSLAALAALAALFILRHRRKNLYRSQVGEEYHYGGQRGHDPNTPTAGYYNVEAKEGNTPPAEVYGSLDVKYHLEPQELGSPNHVHELGNGQDHQDLGKNLSERDKKLPEIPHPGSPSPVSPDYR